MGVLGDNPVGGHAQPTLVGLCRCPGPGALRRAVLKAAFEGRLVPQDPSNEPASVLPDRIRAGRSAQPIAKAAGEATA